MTDDAIGIIPALAGNTFGRVEAVAGAGDHPRSRGEYHRHEGRAPAETGSSPLSRGIPDP